MPSCLRCLLLSTTTWVLFCYYRCFVLLSTIIATFSSICCYDCLPLASIIITHYLCSFNLRYGYWTADLGWRLVFPFFLDDYSGFI